MHSGNHPPETPMSGPKYLQRPPDPLKDGSIFHMGLGLPRTDGSRSQSATRFAQRLPLQAAPLRATCSTPCNSGPSCLSSLQDLLDVWQPPVMRLFSVSYRQPPSMRLEAANGMGGQPYTPAASTRASPGRALFQSPATEQLSRSEIARQIRANFDNLVRASPLPRVRATF